MRKLTEQEALLKDAKTGHKRLEPYKGSCVTTAYQCVQCGEQFYVKPNILWSGKQARCRSCGNHNASKSIRLTEDEAKAKDDKVGAIRLEPYQGNRVKHLYQCKICGQNFRVLPGSIWRQNTASCGCYKSSQTSKRRTLTQAEVVNRCNSCGFKVVGKYQGGKNGKVGTVLLECPYCNKHFIPSNLSDLWYGKIKSCGCMSYQWVRDSLVYTQDEANLKFENMGYKLLSQYVDNKTKVKVLCRCGEGIIEAKPNAIWTQEVASCGCISRSTGEHRIKEILADMNVTYLTEQCFNWCKDKAHLYFDFYIPTHNLLIEYQGDIHFTHTGGWNTPDSLIARQRRDQIKRDCCAQHGIDLLEIPYTEYDNIEQILKQKLGVK